MEYGEPSSDKMSRYEESGPNQHMPDEFYQEIEGFLMRPTPSLHQFNSPKLENMLLSDVNNCIPVSKTTKSGPTLLSKKLSSPLIKDKLSNSKLQDNIQPKNIILKKSKEPIQSKEVNVPVEDILEEAFKYHRVSSEVPDNNSNNNKPSRDQHERRAKSSNSIDTEDRSKAYSPSQSKLKHAYGKKNGSSSNLVNRLRDQTTSQQSTRGANNQHIKEDFNVSAMPVKNLKKAPVDYNGIMENLASGSMLLRLREELSASQEALDKTQCIMKDIVQDTLYGSRGHVDDRRR